MVPEVVAVPELFASEAVPELFAEALSDQTHSEALPAHQTVINSSISEPLESFL